jgi:hypothetical protein
VGAAPRHAGVIVVILPLALWLASKGQSPRVPVMAAVATRPAASGASLPSTYTRALAAISSRRRHPWLSPTLAAPGDPVPCSPTRSRRRRRRRGEGGAQRRPEQHRPPRSRSRPRGGAGPAGATRACDLCFLDFLSTAPSSFPYQRHLLPRHSAAHPFTDACTSSRGHPGEDAASPPLWMPRPSSRGGAPPRRRAAASEAGHRARLGCHFLQVPPPSSTRAPPA